MIYDIVVLASEIITAVQNSIMRDFSQKALLEEWSIPALTILQDFAYQNCKLLAISYEQERSNLNIFEIPFLINKKFTGINRSCRF